MAMTISSVNVPVCSFRGSYPEDDTIKVKDVSSQVKAVTDEFKETSDVLADGAQAVTESVGTLGTSAIGLWTIAKKPFDKIGKFFTKIKYTDKLDDAGNKIPEMIKVIDDFGKPVIDAKTNEQVVKVVRQVDWKKLGIAGGIVAAGIATLAIVNKIKNEKAEKAEQTEQTQKVEEKNIDVEA